MKIMGMECVSLVYIISLSWSLASTLKAIRETFISAQSMLSSQSYVRKQRYMDDPRRMGTISSVEVF